MNYNSEKSLERNFKLEIEDPEIGGACIKLLSTVAGLPDRLVLVPSGRVFFIEFKTTGKAARPLQLWWHKRLSQLGFKVFIIDSEESYKTVLQYAREIHA